jgi:hypothetical protein
MKLSNFSFAPATPEYVSNSRAVAFAAMAVVQDEDVMHSGE